MKLALIKDGIVKAVLSVEDKEAFVNQLASLEETIEVVEISEGTEVSILDTYVKGKFVAAEKVVESEEELKAKQEAYAAFVAAMPKPTAEDFGK